MERQTPAEKPDKGDDSDKPKIIFELGPIQVFEDHDTRGDPRYPPAKLPRNLPRDMRPRWPSHDD